MSGPGTDSIVESIGKSLCTSIKFSTRNIPEVYFCFNIFVGSSLLIKSIKKYPININKNFYVSID